MTPSERRLRLEEIEAWIKDWPVNAAKHRDLTWLITELRKEIETQEKTKADKEAFQSTLCLTAKAEKELQAELRHYQSNEPEDFLTPYENELLSDKKLLQSQLALEKEINGIAIETLKSISDTDRETNEALQSVCADLSDEALEAIAKKRGGG